MTGVGRFLRQRLAEDARWCSPIPVGSVLAPLVETGEHGRGRLLGRRRHRRGLRAADLRPLAGDEGLLDLRHGELRRRARAAAQGRHPRRLVHRHAARGGAALLPRADRRRSASSRFVCDTGNKYLSKVFNDYWMADQGFVEREQHGDLRDLVIARYARAPTIVVVGPNEPCSRPTSACGRRRLAAAGDGGRPLVGIVDESDILDALVDAGETMAERFRDAGRRASWSRKLETVCGRRAGRASSCRCFDRGHVALVMDGGEVPRPDHPHRPDQLFPACADR